MRGDLSTRFQSPAFTPKSTMCSYVSCFAPPIQARPALKTAHEAHAAVAFCRISSHFRRIFSHFRRILSHFRRIFLHFSHFCFILCRPLPHISHALTRVFPWTDCRIFRIFPQNLSRPPRDARRGAKKTKSEKRKNENPPVFGFSFLVFHSWFFVRLHTAPCAQVHMILCAHHEAYPVKLRASRTF